MKMPCPMGSTRLRYWEDSLQVGEKRGEENNASRNAGRSASVIGSLLHVVSGANKENIDAYIHANSSLGESESKTIKNVSSDGNTVRLQVGVIILFLRVQHGRL